MLKKNRREAGSALLLCTIIAIVIMGITGAYLSISIISGRNTSNAMFANQALYAAEGGASAYIAYLNRSIHIPAISSPTPATFNTTYAGATFNITEDNSMWTGVMNGRFKTLYVKGTFAGVSRTLEVIISNNPGGVFWNAIFAPNPTGDPNYTLDFAGTGGQKDIVKGDIYSGGKVSQTADAQLLNADGTGPADQVMYGSTDPNAVTTTGATQNPPPNFVQGTQPTLDVASMAYDKFGSQLNPDGSVNTSFNSATYVDVKYNLTKNGVNGYIKGQTGPSQGNGIALQTTNLNDPAHIFRMNPKDNGVTERVVSYQKTNTVKEDFFIEDPTHTRATGSAGGNWQGTDGGMRVEVAPSGNNKVYYIDGNLWVSSTPAYTYHFLNSTGGPMKITMVVKGNVYLTDNLIYDNLNTDALAIIAIKDSDPKFTNATGDDYLPGGSKYNALYAGYTADQRDQLARDYNSINGTGNIFFGDPGSGTTERFESFLYAENNFYDNNLGAGGTNLTNIYGNMTAGNQIKIKRQQSTYKPMQITFDQRIRNGSVVLPGIPGNPSTAAKDWTISSWKQVGSH